MATLLIQLVGPMQSWGLSSRFTERDTGREPSKSGVIGLVCAAMGRPRDAALDDLSNLRMGVRADFEGVLMRDYQTAMNIIRAKDNSLKDTTVSARYYLADAAFLVGLEGDTATLKQVDTAVRSPHWQIFLGRKAFTPSMPVWIEGGLLSNDSLEQALHCWPRLTFGRNARRDEPVTSLRCVLECPYDERDTVRQDVPVSFASRTFSTRAVRTAWVAVPVAESEVV